MEKGKKVMAIIKNAHYGCMEVGYPVLYFTVYTSESRASLQILEGAEADEFIRAYEVSDVHDLNGEPVWVHDNGCTMTDLEPCIIGCASKKRLGEY